MKALSLKQPWATIIVMGLKDIENRKWKSDHRGSLLIHASKQWDEMGAVAIIRLAPELREIVYYREHYQGAIIGRVDMVGCLKIDDVKYPAQLSKWFFGPYGFVFENPKMFERPIPYRGKLGMFDIPIPDNLVSEEILF